VAELSNGDIAAVGGGTEFTLLAQNGSLILDTNFSIPGIYEKGVSVVADADSALIVSAKLDFQNSYYSDSLIVRKVGPDGHILWAIKLPAQTILIDNNNVNPPLPFAQRAAIIRQNDYLIVSDSEVFSISHSGSLIWQKVYNNGIIGIRSVGTDGQFAIYNGIIRHCDSSGSMIDSVSVRGYAFGFVPASGGYVTTGSNNNQAIMTFITDSIVVWNQSYDVPHYQSSCWGGGWSGANDVIATYDGGYAATGSYEGYGASEGKAPPGGPGLYIIKTDSLGNTASLQIDTFASGPQNAVSELSSSEISLQIFPNPSVDKFEILPGPSGTARLYDLLGREVLETNDNGSGATLDVSHIENETYFLRLGTQSAPIIVAH
jgi:hypothetical protein